MPRAAYCDYKDYSSLPSASLSINDFFTAMRPLQFVLSLVFAATVLIASVDALRCYYGVGGDYKPQDCDELARKLDREYNNPPGTTKHTECATMVMTSHGLGESGDAKYV